MGKSIPLDGIFDPEHPRYGEAGEIRQMYENEPDVKKVIDTARTCPADHVTSDQSTRHVKRLFSWHKSGIVGTKIALLRKPQ
ncbi:hypothetical protein FHS34_002265 [Streptomyces echinatus]|uniref:Uncharacterized protein n=1 Tax=Streptomyces echinatus TaxID=67293 RepID=A0A7W9PRZ4_9ACTN|nr:hypothetical protein [Streptomyces echinatus]